MILKWAYQCPAPGLYLCKRLDNFSMVGIFGKNKIAAIYKLAPISK